MDGLMIEGEVADIEMSQDELSEKPDSNSENSDAEIISRAKKNFKLASESESEIRKASIDDYKFRAGEQWPEDIKNSRDQDKRPCLTINRLPQFVNQVVNDIRQNRPAIKVDPTGDGARQETAEVFEGIIRHIEYDSSADIAYDTAVDHQVTGGFGYFRVITEYENEKSFNLVLKIKRVRNAFSVLLDPSRSEPDGSDANWGHVFDDISRAEFRALYPDAKLSQMNDWTSLGDNSEGWVSKDGCRITEYFERTFKPAKLYLLNTGDAVLENDLPKPPAVFPDGVQLLTDEKGEFVTRETVVPEIKWYKLNGIEILEKRDWPGKWIPIVEVLGTEMIIEGERILEGIIRHAKDPQRQYNFWASAETEMIALAPRTPFIGVEGQFEGHEDKWETANTRNHAFLEYNETSSAGKPTGPPQRNVYEPPVQAITSARMASAEDLKATTGIYDASLGNRSNEQSGVAIQRRNTQAQTSNFHFSDNVKRSIRHAGRILVDLIPKVYDTARAIRIIDEEDQQKIVWVNRVFQEGGEDKIHKLDAGTYDVVCDEGPSYQTKRQEAVSAMLDLTRSVPESAKLWLDLMIQNMDWPGSRVISERIRKTLPPELLDDNKNEKVPPQAQQKLQQLGQMVQQLSQQLEHQNQLINTKRLELESKERIEYEKLLADFRIEAMRTDREHAQLVFKEELSLLHKKLDMLPPTPAIAPNLATGPQQGAQPAQSEQVNQPTGGLPPG
jgi:hypothetical protein